MNTPEQIKTPVDDQTAIRVVLYARGHCYAVIFTRTTILRALWQLALWAHDPDLEFGAQEKVTMAMQISKYL